MEQDHELADYRAHLLDALASKARRSACDRSDTIQVFINERRVGLLDTVGADAVLQVQSAVRIDSVQLRSEDGTLLGGLSAPEYGFRSDRVTLSRDAVELLVRNNVQGGSVTVTFIPEPGFWRRAWRTFAGSAGGSIPDVRPAVVPAMRTVAFAQALLTVVVIGLVADRLIGWVTPDRPPLPVTPEQAPWAAPLADVTRLERQLGEVVRLQAKAVDTIQMQQQGLSELQRSLAKLSSTQETVASSVLTVKQEMEKRQKSSGREVERVTHMLMSKALTEQEQLEAEIHSLTVANDRMSKEMAELEQRNVDLKKRLKAAGLEVSKATVADHDEPMTARQNEVVPPAQPPQVADGRQAAQQSSFLFWVTFSDGVSQESIDQWLREMHGQKGAFREGWQEVAVVHPAIPMDRFVDQVKQAKIVKAVRVSR
jgi:hypothetical protein